MNQYRRNYTIELASNDQAGVLAEIIRSSHADVARQFKLDAANCPKHPSFCNEEWVISDLKRGEKYYIFKEKGKNIGCVSMVAPDQTTIFLNRLSVLPGYRKMGRGTLLVQHVTHLAAESGMKCVSIGLIAEHSNLINWYLKLGFTMGEIKMFDHLPFRVRYMYFKPERGLSSGRDSS